MRTEILRCTKKECLTYTLKKICPKCGSPALSPKPAKFSPEDKYGHYRRLAKQQLLNQKDF